MPVYLDFLQVAKTIFSYPCVVQICLLRLKLANCDRGPGTEEMFLSFILSKSSVH